MQTHLAIKRLIGMEVGAISEKVEKWGGAGRKGAGVGGMGRSQRAFIMGDILVDRQGGSLTLILTDPSTFDSSPRRADSREDFPAPTAPTTASR